ncbi:MAG: hypothetical protein LBU66_09020 [Treponema sp.]|nr:hypothetical protein [Treponema sp.]
MKKNYALCVFLFILITINIRALDGSTPVSGVQDVEHIVENIKDEEAFFIASFAETIGYSYDTIAYGGGLSFMSGGGTAIGFRLLYAVNPEDYIFIEILFLLRYYFFDSQANTGPFIQFNGGPVIYAYETPELTGYGNISAGLSAGWRFLLGKNFFIEPAVRAGYPYIAGAGVSFGYGR